MLGQTYRPLLCESTTGYQTRVGLESHILTRLGVQIDDLRLDLDVTDLRLDL